MASSELSAAASQLELGLSTAQPDEGAELREAVVGPEQSQAVEKIVEAVEGKVEAVVVAVRC